MWKLWPLALIAVVVVVAALVFVRSSGPMPDVIWKVYTDSETGFSISYPPQYAIDVSGVASGTPWGSRSFLSIYDPSDTSRDEFHIGPAGVLLIKQPTEADGVIYHTIADYKRSGAADRSIQGASSFKGLLVTVNGMQALAYHFPEGGATDAPIDEYFFIKDDLIYHVAFNALDPNTPRMLDSVAWR